MLGKCIMSNNALKNSDIKISDMCYLTFPCKHHVTIDNKTALLSGTYIYEIYTNANLVVPEHFKLYGDHLKKIKETKEFNEMVDICINTNNIELLNGIDSSKLTINMLYKSCEFSNLDFIIYFMNLRDIFKPINILNNCIKYIMKRTDNNVLTILIYFIDNLNCDLVNSKALDNAIIAKNSIIINYIIGISIRDKIKYNGYELSSCISTQQYNIAKELIEKKLLLNPRQQINDARKICNDYEIKDYLLEHLTK